MGAAMGGGKGPDMSAQQDLQRQSSTELQLGRPLRQLAQNQALETLQTGSAPSTQVPMIQRALEQVLAGGSQARTQAEGRVAASGIGRTPQGTKILTDQDFMAALQASIVPSQVAQGVVDRGLGVSGASIGPSFAGLNTSAGAQAQVGAAGIGAQGQIMSGLLAALTAAGFAACWIAEELYGPMDLRTWRLRLYFLKHPTWWVTRLYRTVGQRVALQLRRTPWMQPPFRWLFDYLLTKVPLCPFH